LANDGSNNFEVVSSGAIWANNANSGKNISNLSTVGHTWGFAIDFNAHLGWVKNVTLAGNWNATVGADPATGTGGITFASGSFSPAMATGSSSVGVGVTGNFGNAAFLLGAAPSGFGGWPTVWTSFKLVATLTPNMAGYLIAQVKVAKASSTFYIDPLAVVT
jgi:hypothetical protein